jgi:hypothetical protein
MRHNNAKNYNKTAKTVLAGTGLEMYDFGGGYIDAPSPDLVEGGYIARENLAGIVNFKTMRILFFKFDPTQADDFKSGLSKAVEHFEADAKIFPPLTKEHLIPATAFCLNCGSSRIGLLSGPPKK